MSRINELAEKARHVDLSSEEKEEQQRLRRSYVERVKKNLKAQLDSVIVVDGDGQRQKVNRPD